MWTAPQATIGRESMARLRRFEDFRFVGTRDSMRVYDTDNTEQLVALQERVESDALADRTLLQSFGPDTLAEARNRGFEPI